MKPITDPLLPDEWSSVYDPGIPLRLFQTRTLVGREQVLSDLQQQLCSGDPVKRLAVEGLPGVGKTTLAAELATSAAVRTAFGDGVLWAGLGPQPSVQTHLSRWATLLDLPEVRDTAGSEALEEDLRQALWSRRMLVVIDDAWSIEDALACTVGGPNCSYLLTTRIPEVATRFAGTDSSRLHELSQEEGIRLLAQIAPTVSRMEPEMLRDLARVVGGLPLALTLMGNYLSLQARHKQRRRLQTALSQLRQAEERLRLGQPQAGLERDLRLTAGASLTLQAMIGLSDAVLDEEARQVLYILSLFPAKPASFSEEAALAVALTEVEVLDRLVDVGLLESRGADRYSLHQTIADYARSQPLRDQQARQRLVQYFASFIELHWEDQAAVLREHTMIIAAMYIALQSGYQDEFVRSMSTIASSLHTQGFSDFHRQLVWLGLEVTKDWPEWRPLVITMVNKLGDLLLENGAYEQAEGMAEESLALARQIADPRIIILMLSRRGRVAAERHEYAQAETYLREALALARQIDDPDAISVALANLASVPAAQGKFTQAEAELQQALLLARQASSTQYLQSILITLGDLEGKQGKFEQAETHLQEALALARAEKDDDALATALLYAGWMFLREDEYIRAKQNLQEALSLGQRMGRTRIVAGAQCLQALIVLNQGEIEQAQALLQEVYASASQIDHWEHMSLFLMTQGWLVLQQGEYVQAREMFQEALILARQSAHVEYIPGLLFLLGTAAQRLGELEAAYALLQESLALADQIEMPWLKAAGLIALGYYYLAQRNYQQATASFQKIMTLLRINRREFIGWARQGLAEVAAAQDQFTLAYEQGQLALSAFEAIGHGQARNLRSWLVTLSAQKSETDT